MQMSNGKNLQKKVSYPVLSNENYRMYVKKPVVTVVNVVSEQSYIIGWIRNLYNVAVHNQMTN